MLDKCWELLGLRLVELCGELLLQFCVLGTEMCCELSLLCESRCCEGFTNFPYFGFGCEFGCHLNWECDVFNVAQSKASVV